MSVLWNANIAQSINQTFDPKKPTLFYVIDRKNGGVVARYKVGCTFHPSSSSLTAYNMSTDFTFLLLPPLKRIRRPQNRRRRHRHVNLPGRINHQPPPPRRPT